MPAFFKQSPQLPMQLIPGEEVELGSLLLPPGAYVVFARADVEVLNPANVPTDVSPIVKCRLVGPGVTASTELRCNWSPTTFSRDFTRTVVALTIATSFPNLDDEVIVHSPELQPFSPDLLIAPPEHVQLLCQAFPGDVCLASNIALTAIEVGSIQAG